MNSRRDTLYTELAADIEAFRFDERVTRVFADMIRRSVPGYASVIAMTGVLAAEYVQPENRIYDLGCSLGTGLISVHDRINTACELVGIDNSAAMMRACRENLDILPEKPGISIRLQCEDIDRSQISNASLVIMHYTLQFIPPDQRQALVDRIYAGLKPGGGGCCCRRNCHSRMPQPKRP